MLVCMFDPVYFAGVSHKYENYLGYRLTDLHWYLLFHDLLLPWQVDRFLQVSKNLRKFFQFSSLLMFNIQVTFKCLKTSVLLFYRKHCSFGCLSADLDLFSKSLCQHALSAIKLLALT